MGMPKVRPARGGVVVEGVELTLRMERCMFLPVSLK